MGNLCSIFHSRFKNLIRVIPSTRKAQLVDYILLGWQNSTYKLKGSNQKWFMKPYSQIVSETSIPQSTLERYLKQLDDEGFIVRRQALYSRNKEHGVFEVKKGTYIHITDKLLSLIKTMQTKSETVSSKEEDTHIENKESAVKHQCKPSSSFNNCSTFNNNEGIDPLKMRGLYIRDLYTSSLKNTIMVKNLTLSVDNPKLQRLIQQFESIQEFFSTKTKEEIPDEIKKLILGTFFNLTFENQKQLSSPKQVAAEYLYALLNVEFYLPKVSCFKHRNNILSKIIRSNNWQTPKGFYNHFYLGQDFKDKQELRELKWQQQKEREINQQNDACAINNKNEQLLLLEDKMQEKISLIDELTKHIYQESDEEVIIELREKIQLEKKELEYLWHQQFLLENEIEERYLQNNKRCA